MGLSPVGTGDFSWGHGAIGSAPALQAGGCRFESDWLHQMGVWCNGSHAGFKSLWSKDRVGSTPSTPTKLQAHKRWAFSMGEWWNGIHARLSCFESPNYFIVLLLVGGYTNGKTH